MTAGRVLLAMSGGVDSSVAAAILKREGYEVIGATIKTWVSGECRDERAKGCCSIRDIDDARSVAGRLGIPHYVFDLSADFKEKVIDVFVGAYVSGRTPNPCVVCNNDIKFGAFLDKALDLGADYVATGHYARRVRDLESGRWTIREARDPSKDQSYVLFGLTQNQLERALFPVGERTKEAIRRLALELGLRVHDKPDSQEICFVKSHYGEVVRNENPGLAAEGPILDTQGRQIGAHRGYYLYTIGQRKGIGLPGDAPRYVVAIDPERNAVVVGEEADLYRKRMVIEKMNWFRAPRAEGGCEVKIRSRSAKHRGKILETRGGDIVFEFDRAEKSVTPGQAAVLYDGDTLLGGGWISKTIDDKQ